MTATSDPQARVMELLSLYSDPQASAAHFLCDQHDPDSVAYTIVAPERPPIDLSYGELRSESERLAAALAMLGVQQGDRVATLMGKSREYLITVMAVWRLGAVHVPLFTAFASAAVEFRVQASGCRLIVCDAVQRSKLQPDLLSAKCPDIQVVTTGVGDGKVLTWRDLLASTPTGFAAAAVGGAGPIIHIFTSGTTGPPKGVTVPLKALASSHIYGQYALDLRSGDVFWNAADPGWAYGLYFGILTTLLTGVRGILLEGGFSVDTTWRVLCDYGVTNFAAAPTVFRSLRASGRKPAGSLRLRCVSSAGEPLTPEVNDWAVDVLGVQVHDHYGQTEAGMIINNHHHPALRKPLKRGAMGHPMPGWAVAILESDRDEVAATGVTGRLAMDLAESPLAWFAGYVQAPEAGATRFSGNGRWYITGDSGRRDSDGYFYFSSRDDDVIIMAGYRIGPLDIESVLLSHPAISECAAIAVTDEIRGEVLEAVVILRPGYSPGDELTSELQAWVKTRFAAHAYPRRIHYAVSLPKTPSGKLQRQVLRRQLESAAGSR